MLSTGFVETACLGVQSFISKDNHVLDSSKKSWFLQSFSEINLAGIFKTSPKANKEKASKEKSKNLIVFLDLREFSFK